MPSDKLMESAKRAIEKGDRPAIKDLWLLARQQNNFEVVGLIDEYDFVESSRWKEKEQLLDATHRAIKDNNKEDAYSILQKAKEKGHIEVVKLVEKSGLSDLYRTSEDYLRQVEEAINHIESLTVYRYKDIDRQNVHHHHAKSITFHCPEHGTFAISSTSALKILQKTDPAELEICPNCKGFKRARDRLQVNIKLSLDHSKKISELLSFYHNQNLSFLETQCDTSATSNATSLGRFILETAIEKIYYEMLNERQINELADWIQLDEFQEVRSAIESLGNDPTKHIALYTPEYIKFLTVADAKLFQTYLKRARSEWKEMASSNLFEKLFEGLWHEAIGVALSRYQSNPSFIEQDTEILKRLEQMKSRDGGLS
ncbi:hypothetical protein BL107_10696 [Synechococcus sp. BL107]|uniref:hypothetical protein n=1 Tax=Synechococcus sp. BL107 TaxID=313625 RepID=UPI0000E54617|nr:hypothetical protein [Synechococcus sp. BL107]EAU70530.1 hypothetical protein BL107_10696 [Synechococcus sp. BL107]